MLHRILMHSYFTIGFVVLACGVTYYIMSAAYDIYRLRPWDSSIILTYIMNIGQIYSPVALFGIGGGLCVLGWAERGKVKAKATADKAPEA